MFPYLFGLAFSALFVRLLRLLTARREEQTQPTPGQLDRQAGLAARVPTAHGQKFQS